MLMYANELNELNQPKNKLGENLDNPPSFFFFSVFWVFFAKHNNF